LNCITSSLISTSTFITVGFTDLTLTLTLMLSTSSHQLPLNEKDVENLKNNIVEFTFEIERRRLKL